MSKAFTDEEAAPAPAIVRPRAPLPEGVPNYVTERGLALLRDELAGLASEPADRLGDLAAADTAATGARRAELEARIATAEVVARPEAGEEAIRFGASVTVAGASGERCYRIVGVDEADAAHGTISFVSPLARALLGKEAGDTVRLRTPRGEEDLRIVAVAYGE